MAAYPNLPLPTLALPEDRLSPIQQASHLYFRNTAKLNFGRFYSKTRLTGSDRKELGIGAPAVFEYWRQWLFVVSQRPDQYCGRVRDAAQELRIQLLIKVVDPIQVAKT